MPTPSQVEKPVLLRLPEHHVIALDAIVKNSKGRYRSRNDLVTEVITMFLSDLRTEAEEKHGKGL